MSWLGQYNADLVLRNIDANTQLTSLGARQHMLEEELARTVSESNAQRATAEQKAQEAEAQTTELQRIRTALEQKQAELQLKEAELQGKEAELQCEKTTIATLTGTLEEKGRALEEKEVVVRNAEAALKEKEDSLSSLEGVTRVQQEEAQGAIVGLSGVSLLFDSFLPQLILVPLFRAKEEGGRRDCGKGSCQHGIHGGAR